MGRCRAVVLLCLLIAVVQPARIAAMQGAAPAAPVLRADSMLAAADLQADVAILERAFTELHPGLYRYNTGEQMAAAFAALRAEFTRDRTVADAYVAFSLFAAKVKCGHTYANFWNQPKAIQDALFRGGRVPFYFRWLDGRMIVTRSFAGDAILRPGVEVMAINGVPAATILERLLRVARADGSNDAKRVAYMEVQGKNRFEAFDVFFPLLLPSSAPRIALRVRDAAGGAPVDIQVDWLTFEQRLASMKPDVKTDGDGPFFEFRMLDERTGYLRMSTWALFNTKWNWKGFLEESFAALARSGATDLVIDIRENEGGLDVGDVVVSHLAARDVARPSLVRRVRYRAVPRDLVPYLDTWDPSFRDWGTAASEETAGFFTLRRDGDDDPASVIRPAAPQFGGRAWVLVDASNSSATFEFAQTLRRNRLATLIGTPTGGNQRGINGGAFFFLRLPRSGIELDLPLIGQFPTDDRPDAGLDPDILVVPTAADIASGRDVQLEAVKARIRAIR